MTPVGRVRVLVYATADGSGAGGSGAGGSGAGGIEAAYHRISEELAGTAGLLGNALMRSLPDGTGFVVVSEWSDLAAFRAWENGAAHRQATSPLRPYQDSRRGSAFGIYEVVAAY